MIPIYRMLHFFGLAMLFGGTLTSIVLVRKAKPSVETALIAWNSMHLVAVPGLMLLIVTGILHSSAIYWENFVGAGYMHLKVVLVAIVFVLIFIDMRTQKAIIKKHPEPEILVDCVKKRQILALSICILTVIIVWLVSYRPF